MNALVNILSYIYAHIYFPTYSNGLKEIGRSIGYSWTAPDASGIQSIVWRSRWEINHDEAWKQKLVTYNLEDCVALKKVTEILRAIITKTSSKEALVLEDGNHSSVALVRDVEKLTDFHTWGRVNFVHPDYEFINNCAYFDYQRERVYIRTSEVLRKNKAGKPPSPNRKLEVSEQIEIVASQCPVCGSTEIVSGVQKQVRTQEPRIKKVFDLVFTTIGVNRRILSFRTSIYHCSTCGTEFIPDQYQGLDKHYHGLKSWAMYQHVVYRMTLKTIPTMLEDLFGIRVCNCEMHMLKSLMARFYEETYR